MYGRVSRVCWLVLCISSCSGVPFNTEYPTVWTKTYIFSIPEVDPDNEETGTLIVASTESVAIPSWINGQSQTGERMLAPGLKTDILIRNTITANGSSMKKSGFGFITTENMAAYVRDGNTFYQLREAKQLQNTYTVISAASNNEALLSVVIISGIFDFSTTTITFKDGIDVLAVLGNLVNMNKKKIFISGNRVIIKNVNYRILLKLVSSEDLTGTRISCRRTISVISGSMSLQLTPRYVYLDHLVPDNEAGCFYVVFGLPEITGSDVCRIVAIFHNTDIDINGVQTVTLMVVGDFYDLPVNRNEFIYLVSTHPVSAALFVKGSGPKFSDMITLQETSVKNPTHYTFAIPSLESDVNFKHYLVITTNRTGYDNLRVNRQPLPSNTVWLPVPGTDYIGGYVPLSEASATQTIHHASDMPFNVYLVGIGDDDMYGSALITTTSPQTNKDYLKFSLEKTYCERTHKTGNYISNGTQMEVSTVKIQPGKRRVTYHTKHLKTTHLQACQLSCFLYSNCSGVNYTDIPTAEVNCDIVIRRGPRNTYRDTSWTLYNF